MKTLPTVVNRIFKIPLSLGFRTLYRLDVEGAANCPRKGGLLVVANHQSFFDPMLLGVALPRILIYTPRTSLKKSRVYRVLTRLLELEHVERDGRDTGAVRRMIERLKRGEAIALFPEQTRTADGCLGKLTPGFQILASRAGVPVLPVAIDGAFDVWPRDRKWPKPAGRIRVRVGCPLDLASVEREDAVAAVERALLDLGVKERAASPARMER